MYFCLWHEPGGGAKRRLSVLWSCSFKQVRSQCGCWKLNSCRLQEECVLLTAKTILQTQGYVVSVIIWEMISAVLQW